MGNTLGLARSTTEAPSAHLRTSLPFLYGSACPELGSLRTTPHAKAEDLPVIGGHGVPLLEDNTACFLILPMLNPLELENLFYYFFFPKGYHFLLFLCHVAAMNTLQSLSALTKRARWAAAGRNSVLELLLRNTFYELFTVLFQ